MPPLNILLAEDNRGDVFLVREALKEHQIEHALIVVPDGARALQYIEHLGDEENAPCPDLFLLDLNLPKVDGQQVLKHFRKHPICQRVPVIVVTSSDAPRDRESTAALGAARYFRKPADIDEFMRLGEVIKEVLNSEASE